MHEAPLQVVIDAMLEGLQVLGPDWRYLHVNEAAARHGRTTREALLGRRITECYPGIEQTPLFLLMQEVMTSRVARVFDNVFTFPDGTHGHFEVRVQPVPQGICVLTIDTTARQEAEQASAAAEQRLRDVLRMESVGRLAAGLAHDFNNLLTVMLGQCQFTLAKPGGPAREDVAAVLAAAESASMLTRGLLAVGRRPKGTREVGDLAATTRRLLPLLERVFGPRITVVTSLPAGPCCVSVEPFQLEQILVNLILNARDAIVGDGRVTVRLTAGVEHRRRGGDANAAAAPHVCLEVADSGVGMTPATLAHLFEPFYTTKDLGKGTGLGLGTIRDILDANAGDIEVTSEVGLGSTFRVYLPQLPGGDAANVARRSARPEAILLVEDAPEVANLMRRVLQRRSADVRVATTGAEALTIFSEHCRRIDLLVTDVSLEGLCGAEIITRARGEKPGLPVVCTSGYGGAVKGKVLSIPNVKWLDKPFTPEQLLAVVDAALAS